MYAVHRCTGWGTRTHTPRLVSHPWWTASLPDTLTARRSAPSSSASQPPSGRFTGFPRIYTDLDRKAMKPREKSEKRPRWVRKSPGKPGDSRAPTCSLLISPGVSQGFTRTWAAKRGKSESSPRESWKVRGTSVWARPPTCLSQTCWTLPDCFRTFHGVFRRFIRT